MAPFRLAHRSAGSAISEWGWIVAGVLFAWISKRAEQAVSEQIDTEQLIRMTALDPAAMGCRRGSGNSSGPRGCLLRARLVEAARRLAEGRHHRIFA